MQSELLNNHWDDRFYRIPSSFVSIRVDDKAGAKIADIEGNSFKNWILTRLFQKLWENYFAETKKFRSIAVLLSWPLKESFCRNCL